MSILRIGVLAALVIALLPADREQQTKLYERTIAAVHWTSTFCDRNDDTCTQAATAWSSLISKAKFGAQTAYDLATRYANGDAGASQGTLTSQDLEPVWRGDADANGV
jgi:Family of unknown function (DUF5330)